LESKAKIDTVYWQLAHQIVNMHRGLRYVPDEVKELEVSLADQYICNFSVFQSLLDHWALGQLFPIMPIHRLTMPPDRQGTIGEVLAMTQWDKVELMRLLKSQVDDAIKTDFLKPSDAMKLLSDYERLLQEYTYLSLDGTKAPLQPGNWVPLS